MLTKTIVITGTTSGIGCETALALAKQGHTIYMLVRNLDKGEKEKRNILVQSRNQNVHLVKCDLSSLASVREAADILKSKVSSINVLINNAGGIFKQREVGAEGFEMTFAVNHLGHFLLTMSLMPLLERGQARIINVSSDAYRTAKPDMDDLQSERSYNGLLAYSAAKLFNIYFAQSLAEKYAAKGITAYSLHPGVVDSRFGAGYSGFFKVILKLAKPFMVSAEKGAQTSVYLATANGVEQFTGLYFKKSKVAKTLAITEDAGARQALWAKSDLMVNSYLKVPGLFM